MIYCRLIPIKKLSEEFKALLLILIFIFLFPGYRAPAPEDLQSENMEDFSKIEKYIPAKLEPIIRKSIVINELAGWNTNLLEDEDGDYSDWVELYNTGTESVNLKGWYLSDDRLYLKKWMFSATYILDPGEHIVIYLSGKDRRTGRNSSQYHTNFTIDNALEVLYLTSTACQIQDTLETLAPPEESSVGRSGDGLPSWKYFTNPTPGESNSLVIPIPELSLDSGFYNSEDTLEVFAKSIPNGYELRYTINDGVIFDTQYQALNRYEWKYPSNKTGILYEENIILEKTSIIKARFYKNLAAGPEVTYTYFINEESNIPVISLTTDPANLWDDTRGIYVTGMDPEEPNYIQDDWEIPVRFAYFTDSSKQKPDIDITCQLRIFGSATREFPNKSLAIISRDRDIENLFFHNNSSMIYSLLLRTGASDFPRALMRDLVTSELVKPLGLDAQDYQQALLFINGQFWGISNIREKINEEMIEDTYLVDPDQVDLIFGTSEPDARSGTNHTYIEMFNFITKSNLYLDRYYDQVGEYIDIDSFINYIIVETFINNGDWPSNNVKAWKSWEQDSVWRLIIYDTDASYDTEEFWSRNNPYDEKVIGRPDYNSINRLLTSTSIRQIVQIFNSLMLNQKFKEQFIQRYEELVGAEDGVIVNPNALLGTKRLISIIDMLAKNIEPHVPRQITRWLPEYPSYMRPSSGDKKDTSINRWYYQVDILREFAAKRPAYIAQYLEELNTEYIPTGENIVTNGSFDKFSADWNLRWSSDVSIQEIIEIEEEENYVGRVQIEANYQQSNNESDIVAFVHDEINLETGISYELSFRIKCNQQFDLNNTVLVYLFKSTSDYKSYAQIEAAPSYDWQTYKTVFTMTAESDPNARLQFRAGKLPPGITFYIDNIELFELE
ncbi:MAG: CotH kinase family protein [Spirochaetia bacterium]|nr:CotH kinase family protein [Spirochaetia bacterium]